MASYSQKLLEKKYNNWVKAGLAVQFTKEGIEPFVYDAIQQFQLECLDDICYNNGLMSGTTCSNCCTENVVACPTIGLCNRGKCNAHKNSITQYNSLGCPNKICDNFKIRIRRVHRFHRPSYRNTDATQWCSNPWEVAKCFMPPDGYKDVTCVTETDFNGIISVIINHIGFQSKIHDSLGNMNNIFAKAREIDAQVRHSPKLEVDDTSLNRYFTELQLLLSDSGYLNTNIHAQNAKKKLSQLQNDTFFMVFGEEEDHKVGWIYGKTDDSVRSLQTKTEDDVEKISKTTDDSVKTLQTKTGVEQIKQTVYTADRHWEDDLHNNLRDGWIYGKTDDLVRSLQTKTEDDVEKISKTTDDSVKKLQTKTGVEKIKQTVYTADRHWEDDLHNNLRDGDADSDVNEKWFVDSIVDDNELKDTLPTEAGLDALCKVYGRNSDTVKRICDRICYNIKDECKHVVNVWPSYRPNEKNIIVFCVITDIPCERISCVYSIVQRSIGEYSAEESAILKQESDRGLSFTDDAVENCIENNADKYMDNHENLTVMSASLLKSKRFGTTLESVSETVCIVLLVPIKGLIPLSEEAFPTNIDGFPVDVREGCFRYKFGGKPNDKHESLKMGCLIQGDEQGTLGGFLDHKEHGICCLTAAHVMLSTKKMKAIFPGPYVPTSVESCYQPEPPNTFGRLIKAIAKEGNENETGVDVALVKIDERIPLNGRFPDAEEEKWLEAGFLPTLEMQYNTGAVLERKEIPLSSLALKFGQSTTLTDGKVRLRGCAVRNVNLHDNSEGYRYSLKKQIQVIPIGSVPFSEEGDSGSLVFVRGNDDQLIAIGMLVGGTDNYDFVTPICDILREFDTTLSLKPFPNSLCLGGSAYKCL